MTAVHHPGQAIEPHSSCPWHALDVSAVEALLHTGESGLASSEVELRRQRFGPNEIEEEPPPSALVVLARQFRSPLIYILLAAAVVTLLLGEYVDASVIAAVLALNAAIGFTQERKAEGAVRALMALVVPRARVLRGGEEWEVDSRDLVPGDVVLLESGSRVPADLRLTWVNGLQLDESLLTGESLPVAKRVHPVGEGVPLADRASVVYTGTVVTTGRGRGVVVATGEATALGAIAGSVRSAVGLDTPLQQRMARFARVIGVLVAVASVVAFASGVAVGEDVTDMFLTAVALAVAAIPEGLPVAFTIALALGVHRMAQRRAIVRRLPAVETLGSTTVIGSDKTGTLTQNRMTVLRVWAGGVEHEVPLRAEVDPALRRTLLCGVLASEAEVYRTTEGVEFTGDPTEAALLMAAMEAGIEPDLVREQYRTVAEVPFEPELRFSASVREHGGRHELFVKGAPERVAPMCSSMAVGGGAVPIDLDEVHAAARRLAAHGLRVLAMASAELPTHLADPAELPEPDRLVFLGLQGMMDPPREGTRDAVAACRRAGVRVVMITGDHAITARAIAGDLGIVDEHGEVLTGSELAALDDDELRRAVGSVAVFARVSPEDKLRIVHALQANGEVVAVTGDGVNDAPALRAAAIGIAMGRGGTDVAREAADMVLADDDFVTIVAAVEEGRVTFENVRKVTFFLVSCAVASIVAILGAVWLQWPLLMVPAQLLWLNLVTNGIQDVSLAFEPGERGVLDRPPRSSGEGILSRLLWERTLVVGVVMAVGALALFRWELDRGGSLPRAQTVALSTLVVAMAFHAGSSRSERVSLLRLHPFSNLFLAVGVVAALTVHVVALYLPPTQYVLRVEPIEVAAWGRIVAVASLALVVVELDKWLRRRLERVGRG